MRMRMLLLAGAAVALAAGLAACKTDPLAEKFVSLKFQSAGANFSPTTGFTAGYLAMTGHFTPTRTPDGKTLLTVDQPCHQTDVIATFSNLNAKASASASSTGSATAPGVVSPSVAWASGDEAATGAAARVLALGGGLAPTPEALKAYQDACAGQTVLPNAPAGSIVVDGVAPK